MLLVLFVAVASFVFGSGILLRYMDGGSQPSSTVTPATSSARSQGGVSPSGTSLNVTERNNILGVWAKNPTTDDPDVLENWTFYEDGTFSEMHTMRDSSDPPSFDHGTWQYTGNTSYLVVLNGEQMNIMRTGNILTNVDDQCTFHRIG